MSSIRRTIIFSKPGNPRTGFLSNESKHSFVIDGKRWPTVEHYLQAKKFEGTQYEDEIRLASTVFQAKKMGDVRFITISGKKVKAKRTPKGQIYHMREDWNKIKETFMREAIKAKFMQNSHLQTRLIDTHKVNLVEEDEPLTGKILKEVRGVLSRRRDLGGSHANLPIKDLNTNSLNREDKKMVWKIIHLSEHIAELEKWNLIQPKMVNDAAYNLTPKNRKLGLSIGKYIDKVNKIPWSEIYVKYPNYEEIIKEIQEILTRKKLADDKGVAQNMASVLMWLEQEATPKQKKAIYDIGIDVIWITFPKEDRAYRASPPLKIPKKFRDNRLWKRWKKFSKTKKKKYKNNIQEWTRESPEFKDFWDKNIKIKKSEQKKFDDWIEIAFAILETPKKPKQKGRDITRGPGWKIHTWPDDDDDLESSSEEEAIYPPIRKKKPKKRVVGKKIPKKRVVGKIKPKKRVIAKKSPVHKGKLRFQKLPSLDFLVLGEGLEKHVSKLLSIGGKFPKKRDGSWDKTKIKIPFHKEEELVNFFFELKTDDEKYESILNEWRRKKILGILDTSVQFSHLKSTKKIDDTTIKNIISDIYGCKIKDVYQEQFNYNKIINDLLNKNVYLKSFTLTSTAKQLLSNYIGDLSLILTENTKGNYKSLENKINSSSKDIQISCKDRYTFNALEICVLKAIRSISYYYKTFLKTELTPKICERAFLSLLPPEVWRVSAEQFISMNINTYEDWMAMDEIENQLRNNGVNYSLKKIKKLFKADSTFSIFDDCEEDCERCLIIFASGLFYLIPYLNEKYVLNRIIIMSNIDKSQVEG